MKKYYIESRRKGISYIHLDTQYIEGSLTGFVISTYIHTYISV